jgi:hypothetical protein
MTRNMIFCLIRLVISLNMLISRFIHFPANNIINTILFFFMVEYFSIVYIYHMFFIHSSVFGYLGWFKSLLVMNSHIINVGMQVCLFYVDLHSFTSIPKSGIAGSEGRSNFTVSMKLHTDFHSNCTCLLTYQHCIQFPFAPHPGQIFLLIFSWILPFWQGWDKISVKLRCALSYGWGHWTFPHLSVICISSENHLFNSFCHLLIGMLGFWVANLLSSLYILRINHLSPK